MVFHCLFEQSGTFKNEAKKLGYEAYDYDILDEFGETDFQIDLFKEIRGGYEGHPSIFDDMSPDDIILAFFPCTRFEAKVALWFRGENYGQRTWTDEQNLEMSIKMHNELNELYVLISMLSLIAIRRSLKLIIENPYTQPHYLTMFWCLKPAIIDKDRSMDGDFYKKPTQYWFIGCNPKQNLVFEPIDYVEQRIITKEHAKTQRSMIHPQYANRFIRKYLIDETEV